MVQFSYFLPLALPQHLLSFQHPSVFSHHYSCCGTGRSCWCGRSLRPLILSWGRIKITPSNCLFSVSSLGWGAMAARQGRPFLQCSLKCGWAEEPYKSTLVSLIPDLGSLYRAGRAIPVPCTGRWTEFQSRLLSSCFLCQLQFQVVYAWILDFFN